MHLQWHASHVSLRPPRTCVPLPLRSPTFPYRSSSSRKHPLDAPCLARPSTTHLRDDHHGHVLARKGGIPVPLVFFGRQVPPFSRQGGLREKLWISGWVRTTKTSRRRRRAHELRELRTDAERERTGDGDLWVPHRCVWKIWEGARAKSRTEGDAADRSTTVEANPMRS